MKQKHYNWSECSNLDLPFINKLYKETRVILRKLAFGEKLTKREEAICKALEYGD